MARYRVLAAALGVAAVLSGCSTVVTYTSDLYGADVKSRTGQFYGVTPVSVSYNDDDLKGTRGASGCPRVPGVTYTWPSGATASTPDMIELCGSGNHVVKLDRPQQVPNIEKDLQTALQIQKRREAELQAELERERLYRDDYWMWPRPYFWGPPPRWHRHR